MKICSKLRVPYGIVAIFLGFVTAANAEILPQNLCSVPWYAQFDTQHLNQPKVALDETGAAYGTAVFINDISKTLLLRGTYPKSRYLSLNVYDVGTATGSFGINLKSMLYDVQIAPEKGSTNSFMPGADRTARLRNFRIQLLPPGSSAAPNSLVSGGEPVQALTVRIYAPDEGVAIDETDMPKLYAYDARTGLPTSCPEFISLPQSLTIPTRISSSAGKQIAFTPNGFESGGGNGATTYLSSNNDMPIGQVAIVTFRAPRFENTHNGALTMPSGGDVRYWSMCAVDFRTGYTNGCTPDWAARVNSTNGRTTLVIGRSAAVQQSAIARGASFLWDTRGANSTALGFMYRTMLATPDFNGQLYQPGSDFYPRGVICNESDYLSGKCGL